MRSSSAFSLIELLIVLLVLAILFSIAVPGFLGARRRAYDAAAQAYLREAAVHQFSYAVGHGGYAETLEELRSEGLREVPGVELKLRSGGASFCMFARHRLGRYWYTATPEKLVRTNVAASQPAPSDCP